MLLNEIMNNDPTIFVDRLLSVARHKKGPRVLAQSLRRKADRQGSELDTPDGRSKFIDTHGQVTWQRDKQNETPRNMGPKIRDRF